MFDIDLGSGKTSRKDIGDKGYTEDHKSTSDIDSRCSESIGIGAQKNDKMKSHYQLRFELK